MSAQETVGACASRRRKGASGAPDARTPEDEQESNQAAPGLSQPQYRLRVGDIRVFYDVTETQVQVLAIVTKAEATAWLDQEGTLFITQRA
jgi:hypothetical protein